MPRIARTSTDRGSSTRRSSYSDTALSMGPSPPTDTASLFGIHSATYSDGPPVVPIIRQPDTDKYDFVITVAEGSINTHFNHLWKENERKWKCASLGATKQKEVCLAVYTYRAHEHGDMKFLHSKIKVPRVELLD